MDEFYSVDEKYQSNQVVKISKKENNGTSLDVDYNGQNASSVKNVNNHPDIQGDLFLDAEYIFGGGPKPPEYNYYLKTFFIFLKTLFNYINHLIKLNQSFLSIFYLFLLFSSI